MLLIRRYSSSVWHKLLTLCMFFVVSSAGSLRAEPIVIESMSVTLTKPQGLFSVKQVSPTSLLWPGTGTGGSKSTLDASVMSSSPFATEWGTQFGIAEIAHHHGTWDWIIGLDVQMDVSMDVTIEGQLFQDIGFSFDFLDNGSGGGVDSVDIFDVSAAPVVQHQTFLIEDREYRVKIMGFYMSGQQISDWTASENETAVFHLMGNAGHVTQPEPSTYLLLGMSLVVVMMVQRRREAAALRSGFKPGTCEPNS